APGVDGSPDPGMKSHQGRVVDLEDRNGTSRSIGHITILSMRSQRDALRLVTDGDFGNAGVVVRPENNTRIAKITVGDEPQSVTLTPHGQYGYVANASAGSVPILQINDPALVTFHARVGGTVNTGR